MLGTGPGPCRFGGAPYRHWRAHVVALLTDAGAEDPEATVDVLLSPLAPEVYQHQRHTLGLSPERIAEALGRLARGVLTGRRIS